MSSSSLLPSPSGGGGVLSPRAGHARSPRGFADGTADGVEDLMQDFVRLHMMSILHPFAEQIRDIQAQTQELTLEMAQKCLQVENHKTRLDDHEHRLSAVSTAATEANTRLESTQAELASVRKEESKLGGGQELTKAALNQANEKLQSVVSTMEALQQSIQDTDGKVCKLQGGLADTDAKIAGQVETRLNNMNSFSKELHDKHMDLQQTCQQVKAFGETASQNLNKLMMSIDRQRQEDLEKFNCLSAHASGFEAKLNESSHTMQKHAENLKAMSKEFQQLKDRAAQLVTAQQMQTMQSEVVLSHKETARRLGKLEEDINQQQSDFGAEKQTTAGFMQNLAEQADKNASDVNRLKEILQSHTEQLQSSALRTTGLENDQRKCGKRLDASDREAQSLSLWQQGATDKFEVHSAELERTHGELQLAHKGLEATNTSIDGMKGDLSTAQEVMSKIGSRLDLLHKYFHGLGKGLQDTHRHVAAGEGGMLAPKNGFGMALPVIPCTPRGTMASPRRQKTFLNDAILTLSDAAAATAAASPKCGRAPAVAMKPPI